MDFSAPVPPFKRDWVALGIGSGWLREAAEEEGAVVATGVP